MKILGLLIVLVIFFGGCWGSGSDSDDADTTTELSLNRSVQGNIAAVGEVDWYHFRVVEANNILKVTCRNFLMVRLPRLYLLLFVARSGARGPVTPETAESTRREWKHW